MPRPEEEFKPGEMRLRRKKCWLCGSKDALKAEREAFEEAAKMARAMGLEAMNKGTMAHEMTQRYLQRLAVRFEERAKAFEDTP